MSEPNLIVPTVVLVHAAWADASSWNKVIPPLQRKRMSVLAVQIPLTSLSDDVATVRRTLKRVSGPVVLVGRQVAIWRLLRQSLACYDWVCEAIGVGPQCESGSP